MLINNFKKTGFTLIELVIYLSMASVLLLAIGGVVVEALFLKTKTEALSNVAYNSRILISDLEYLIADARTIISPTRTNKASSVTFSANSVNVTIDNYNGRIRVRRGSEPAYYLTEDNVLVKNLEFHNLTLSNGSPSLKISLDIEALANTRLREYSYSEKFFVTLNSKIR